MMDSVEPKTIARVRPESATDRPFKFLVTASSASAAASMYSRWQESTSSVE